MSKKKPNLSIKRKIAKEYVLGKPKRSELPEKHNVGYQVVWSVIEQSENLVNLDSDASILDGKYIKQKTKSKYQEIDEYLVSNIVTLREKGGLISKNIIKSLAHNYNKKYNTDFNITRYFANAFVKRNGLVYRTLHGESKTASNNDISGFSDELTTLYHNYDIKDIFNLDETGVFLKNSGNKTYVMDKKDSKNIKQQKTRLTVMLEINELNEKLPLLIIGKSRNPRYLKGINVLNAFNTYYYSNKTSWLTREIFENYIFHLNLELLKTQIKILIFFG